MAIYELDGISPELGDGAWVADSAEVIGRVHLGKNANVWPQVVIRGDNEPIRIGAGTNIQDAAVLHSDYGWPLTLGENVSIGHQAMVHGCTIHDNVLIGMGSIVMDACVVHSNAIIAAGAVVLEGTIVEAGSIYAGVPAKKVKMVSEDLIHGEINRISNNYVKYASWFSDYNEASNATK